MLQGSILRFPFRGTIGLYYKVPFKVLLSWLPLSFLGIAFKAGQDIYSPYSGAAEVGLDIAARCGGSKASAARAQKPYTLNQP